MSSSHLLLPDGTDDTWGAPAAALLARAAEAIDEALWVDQEPIGQVLALRELDRACRRIAAAVKTERHLVLREMVEEHGVAFTAGALGLDPTTVRHAVPQHARFQRAAHPKARERQAVELYQQGLSVDAVSARLKMGHRHVKRLVLAAGIGLRETHDQRTKENTDGD